MQRCGSETLLSKWAKPIPCWPDFICTFRMRARSISKRLQPGLNRSWRPLTNPTATIWAQSKIPGATPGPSQPTSDHARRSRGAGPFVVCPAAGLDRPIPLALLAFQLELGHALLIDIVAIVLANIFLHVVT